MLSRPAAWVLTGPIGHLAAGLLDWAQLVGVVARERRRKRRR